MSEMKHTPGRWIVEDEDYICPDGGLHICSMSHLFAVETQRANARLIAAAPDLLRELVHAVDIHRHEGFITCPETCWCWDAEEVIIKATNTDL